MRVRMAIKLAFFAAIVLLSISVGGCYYVRVVAFDTNPSTDAKTITDDAFFWGLVHKRIQTQNCEGNALAEVSVSANAWQGLASILTLGIWHPFEVAYKCGKDKNLVTHAQ